MMLRICFDSVVPYPFTEVVGVPKRADGRVAIAVVDHVRLQLMTEFREEMGWLVKVECSSRHAVSPCAATVSELYDKNARSWRRGIVRVALTFGRRNERVV